MDSNETGIEGNIVSDEAKEKKENIFFPETRSITEEEFIRLPRDVSFRFNMNNEVTPWAAEVKIRKGQSRIAAEFNFDVREKLDPNRLKQFFVQNEGRKLGYPIVTESQPDEQKSEKSNKESYYVDGLSPRKLETDRNKIEKMDSKQVAQLLNETDGSGLIFYTGAGISMGGDRPVWGMSKLWEELGLKGDGNEFSRVFRNPNEYPPSELIAKVDEFKAQLFEDVSTPAHVAIADIVASKEGSIVFTENVDLKHEAEGSRLAAIHMDSDSGAFTKAKLRSSEAKVLMTVGLSADDRAMIQYLKQQNPDLKVVAFTLSEETIPKYLDENDAVVLGDAQEILPLIAEVLNNNADIEKNRTRLKEIVLGKEIKIEKWNNFEVREYDNPTAVLEKLAVEGYCFHGSSRRIEGNLEPQQATDLVKASGNEEAVYMTINPLLAEFAGLYGGVEGITKRENICHMEINDGKVSYPGESHFAVNDPGKGAQEGYIYVFDRKTPGFEEVNGEILSKRKIETLMVIKIKREDFKPEVKKID